MNIFEKVLELQAERTAIREKVLTYRGEIDGVLTAIKERIEHDRKRTDDRISELKVLSNDEGKAVTTRSLYLAELKKLEGISFSPTEDEQNTLLSLLSEYEQAAKDFKSTHRAFLEALRKARVELDAIREIELKGIDPDLVLSWVSSEKRRVNSFIGL